ncbi:MAG: TOBE domain-containing protein, partial [Synechococcaceae bacterium WB9_2_112]|nr:TOBE domain-containing protein [Synechococcaceae bacterium WB9_2_112]
NLFVAQFIGSPPMNLLPLRVAGPSQVLLGERRLQVEGPQAAALAGRLNEALTGGLRPEHLRLAPAANRNLAAEVSHIEALGNEQLITCRLLEGSHLVLVRARPDQAVAVGQSVHLEVDPAGWRLFDSAGNALPLPELVAAKPPELPEFGG